MKKEESLKSHDNYIDVKEVLHKNGLTHIVSSDNLKIKDEVVPPLLNISSKSGEALFRLYMLVSTTSLLCLLFFLKNLVSEPNSLYDNGLSVFLFTIAFSIAFILMWNLNFYLFSNFETRKRNKMFKKWNIETKGDLALTEKNFLNIIKLLNALDAFCKDNVIKSDFVNEFIDLTKRFGFSESVIKYMFVEKVSEVLWSREKINLKDINDKKKVNEFLEKI